MEPPVVSDTCDLSPESFSRLASFITGELGIKMPESKLTMVQSRLLRRVRELGLNSVQEYGDYFFASSSAAEREQFINAITTNKTDFFREPAHFDYLTRTALPTLAPRQDGFRPWHLKAWSAGCSSGEEPYTLAMVLSEYGREHRGFEFSILGTDISTRVLEAAHSGIYREALIAPVPPELRRRYLLRSRDREEPTVRIVPDLRRAVSFQRVNFMDEDYRIKEAFQVIFFRNVMIYFDRSTQERVLARICRNLAPGGYLFMGHSESLAMLDVPVKSVHPAVFRKAV